MICSHPVSGIPADLSLRPYSTILAAPCVSNSTATCTPFNVGDCNPPMSSNNTTRSSPAAGSSSLGTSIEAGQLSAVSIQKLKSSSPTDASPRPISRKGKAQIQGSPTWSNVLTSDGTPDFLRNGPDRASMTGTYPQPRKSRSGGLKNTFRRLFGRKSAKDRISLPAPAGYPRHVS